MAPLLHRFFPTSRGTIALTTLSVVLASCSGALDDPNGSESNQPNAGAAGEFSNGGQAGVGAGGTAGDVSSAGAGGDSSVAGAGGNPTTASGWPSFGAAKAFQLRRLTNEQYKASAQALLGINVVDLPPIEEVPAVAGFSAIGASSVAVSGAGVGQFENAARSLAAAALATSALRAQLVPCTPTGPNDTVCFTEFAATFGRRAFRRPLSENEATRYATLTAEIATSTGDVWQGLEATVSAFLQSPNFLYLPEVGEPDPTNLNRYRYTRYEMASRLAYFLTGSTPDDALLDAAAAGTLDNPEGIQAEAERLLELPAAHDTVGAFFSALLSLHNLDNLTRPTELFPQFTTTLGAAMKQETLLVVDDLVFGRDGDYRHLFDQQETFVNAELAALYGVPAPAGNGFERVALPASSGRVGLIGQAGVLAARDHSDGTSPTKRGLFVLTRLLCQNLPLAPPANMQIPAPPSGILTAREKFEEHAKNDTCASCHSRTDPVGLSLEHFDAMGVYRETDHGLAIDDSGRIGSTEYKGLAGLAAILRDHPALLPCLLQSLYGVGVGHLATEFDRDTFSAMASQFDADGARIRPLLAKMVQSDGFRYLPLPTEQN